MTDSLIDKLENAAYEDEHGWPSIRIKTIKEIMSQHEFSSGKQVMVDASTRKDEAAKQSAEQSSPQASEIRVMECDDKAFLETLAENRLYRHINEDEAELYHNFVSYYESCKATRPVTSYAGDTGGKGTSALSPAPTHQSVGMSAEIDQDALGEAMLTLRPQVWRDQEAKALAGEIPMVQIAMQTEIWAAQFRPYLERAIKAYLKASPMRESVEVTLAKCFAYRDHNENGLETLVPYDNIGYANAHWKDYLEAAKTALSQIEVGE